MTKAINFACACARAAAKVFHRSEGSTLCRPSPSPRLRSQIATRPTHPHSKPPGQTIKIPQDVAAPHSKALQLIMRIWRIFFPGGANTSTWLTQIRTHTWRRDAVCQFACLPSTGWHHDLHGYGCLRRLNVSKWKGIYMSAPVVTKWRMGWAWVWSKCKFKGVNKPAANGGTLIVDNPRNYPLWKSH